MSERTGAEVRQLMARGPMRHRKSLRSAILEPAAVMNGHSSMVKNLGLTAGTQYQVSFNITSTVDKNIFVKLDDTGLIAETVTLTADTQYQYAKTTEAGTPGNNIFYIAFGRTEVKPLICPVQSQLRIW